MLVTKLTVVNACLASMGEGPINSLAEDNMFINAAVFAFENAIVDELSIGWWFNKERLKIKPNAEGRYQVPTDVLDLDVKSAPGWLALRGRFLYDNNNADYLKGKGVYTANILRLVDFEDIPIIARRLIKAATVVKFQAAYDGDQLKISEAQAEYQMAYIQCRSQHIRAVGANFGGQGLRVAMAMRGGSVLSPNGRS